MPHRIAATLAATAVTTGAVPGSPTDAVARVAPGLARYRDRVLADGLWTREELSVRDRSLITVAHLVVSGQSCGLEAHLHLALDCGVTPAEVSETLTHLAFYGGWQNAADAAVVVERVFEVRGITTADLPPAEPGLLPLDEAAEATRAAGVEANFGAFFPGVVASTGEVLFRDLWRRPDLAPRDRSLITVVGLVSTGNVAQITFHLGRALDNGLTPAEAGEVLHHLAFHAGWPKVFTAMPVVSEVLAARTG